MREVERYLKRATRGLWGRARRNARLELRGAIEDKVYRSRLLGLGEQEAIQAALRDLGDPRAIALDLNRVHTLPSAVRAALLAGVTALLGMQALAQVPTVRAIPAKERTASECRSLRPDELKKLSAQQRQVYEQFVESKGGIEGAVAWCKQNTARSSDLLSLADLKAALSAAGVQVDELSGVEGYLILSFPGEKAPQGLNLSYSLQKVNGQDYVQKLPLLNALIQSVRGVSLKLNGLVNPVLQIGPAKLQLGTEAAPIKATDLYAFPLIEELEARLKQASNVPRISVFPEDWLDDFNPHLRVPAPDGTVYAMLSNEWSVYHPAPLSSYAIFTLAIRSVQGGTVPVPSQTPSSRSPQLPRVVNTPAELLEATEHKEVALLVYQLNPSDLRNLKLTPVSAAQVRWAAQP